MVYDLVPVLTPQDNFEDRDLDNYGVCEIIDLSFSTSPSGITEYDIGGLKWEIISGSGFMTDNGNGTGVYECADVADTVTLGLKITGGPMADQVKAAPVICIVPPTGHACAQTDKTGLWHKKDKQGCKVKLDFWATSGKAVSFTLIECREGESDPSEEDGIFAGTNGEIHTPSDIWVSLGAFVAGKGYKWAAIDTSGFTNNGDFGDGNNKQNIYMMYRSIKTGIADPTFKGHKHAECLSKMQAVKTDGVAKVWKDPVGPFMRAAADADHQNYDP